MNNPEKLSKTAKTSRNIFFISMLILVLSLLPVSYSMGYSSGNLSGAAGLGDATPPITSNAELGALNTYITVGSTIVGIFSALITSFSSIRSVQIENRAQKLILERIKIDDEMQKREIEKLRLELEVEKQKKEKIKQRAEKQRKQTKAKKQIG